ncbi:MAG: response regulator [Bacteroidetes bacterium]|nr:response regulator [Bacteroidota bacterium]
MINLIMNALKFTHAGTIEFGYSKETLNNRPSLLFYVKDTGIGIPEEQCEVIFDLFRQADDSHTRSHNGAGIGLSVSKKLTELLGGKMWVESSEGVGSMFYFTLPVKTKYEVEKEVDLKPDYNISFNDKTILIVEDIEASYEFLDHLLRGVGAQTFRAADGEEALKICRENPALDLVLMDIQLPLMNGYEATKKIKKERPALPVIAQTAYAMAGDMNKSIQAGCDGYISKPIKKEELFRILRKVLHPQEGLKAS